MWVAQPSFEDNFSASRTPVSKVSQVGSALFSSHIMHNPLSLPAFILQRRKSSRTCRDDPFEFITSSLVTPD